MNDWLEELTEEEEAKVIDQLAEIVGKRSMETPAILFLELHKPLARIGAHSVIAGGPFIAPFLGSDQTSSMSRLMATPGGIERLIQRLEDQRLGRRQEEPDEQPQAN